MTFAEMTQDFVKGVNPSILKESTTLSILKGMRKGTAHKVTTFKEVECLKKYSKDGIRVFKLTEKVFKFGYSYSKVMGIIPTTDYYNTVIGDFAKSSKKTNHLLVEVWNDRENSKSIVKPKTVYVLEKDGVRSIVSKADILEYLTAKSKNSGTYSRYQTIGAETIVEIK